MIRTSYEYPKKVMKTEFWCKFGVRPDVRSWE